VEDGLNNKTHKVSNVLLDFIFGEPMAQPEVIEQDTEKAWQEWTDAMTARDAADDDRRDTDGFEITRPMSLMH
jgi:hypothetical protein